jgi:hydrogenase/urease accessory protein HupE
MLETNQQRCFQQEKSNEAINLEIRIIAVATAMLHLAGIGFGMLMQKANLPTVSRFAGGAVALGGFYLAIS